MAGTIFALGLAGPHHRLAHAAHHGAHVGEVEVDEAFLDHQIGDAGNAREQHFVGHRERVGEGGLFVGHTEKVLVGNDDQGIDMAMQLVDPLIGQLHAAIAFELERLGHHADRQYPLLASGAGNHGRGARPRATAHAAGDEHHVRAGKVVVEFIETFFGGRTAHLGVRPRTEAFGNTDTELYHALGAGKRQRLSVGIGHDELDAFKARINHVVDRVAACTTDAKDGDSRLKFLDSRNL